MTVKERSSRSGQSDLVLFVRSMRASERTLLNGGVMHRANMAGTAAAAILGCFVAIAIPAYAQSVTAYEGPRLIVGDGSVIENATLVVDGTRIAQVGPAAAVRVPAGANRVNVAGKTVMPMIIDTHVHLSNTRDALLRDLRR